MSRYAVMSLVAVVLSSASLYGQSSDVEINGQHPWLLEDIIAAVEDEPEVVLGVLEGSECEVFGSITDAMVDAEGRIFVLDARHMPAVHRYTSDGELAFAGDFPGFVRADLVERDGRVRGYRPSSEGLHYAISAVPLASSAILLQSGPPRDVNRMFGQVNSARFDVEAGALAPVDEALPYLLAARGRWLVAATQASPSDADCSDRTSASGPGGIWVFIDPDTRTALVCGQRGERSPQQQWSWWSSREMRVNGR